jgi:hypothetical protein
MPSDADFSLVFPAGVLVRKRGRLGPTPVLTTNRFRVFVDGFKLQFNGANECPELRLP